jgi:hypothetical protein
MLIETPVKTEISSVGAACEDGTVAPTELELV